MTDDVESGDVSGVSRRTLLRRGAILGGALVWTAPAVQSIATPAFAQAQGSGCAGHLTVQTTSGCKVLAYVSYPAECCDANNLPTLTLDCIGAAELTPATPDSSGNLPSC